MKNVNIIIEGIDKILTILLLLVITLLILSGIIGGCIYLWKIILRI